MNSRIFKLLLIGVIAVLIGTVAVLLWPGTSPTATPHDAHDEHGGKSQQQWTCPMHPQIVRDHPGQCPICNMDLVLVLSDVAVPVPASESEDAQYGTTYYCPMHPSYRSDKPGNCPICNMTLIRMKDGANDGTTSKVYEHATVTITPDRQQLIGVKTRVVEKKPFAKMIRAVGRVDFDGCVEVGRVDRGAIRQDDRRDCRDRCAIALDLQSRTVRSETQLRARI
jgi:hypothetical protein